MVCFATILEDGLWFLYVTEGLLLFIPFQKAQSQIIIGLGCLLMIGSTDLKDVDERALCEGDWVLDLVIA